MLPEERLQPAVRGPCLGRNAGGLEGDRLGRERQPDLRIALLEAEICGHGPSGRNGGFVHGYWASLAGILPVLGEEIRRLVAERTRELTG